MTVNIEFIHRNPTVDSSQWEEVFRVAHVEQGISFYIETALARTCSFNMICGLSRTVWAKTYSNPLVTEELRAALYDFFHTKAKAEFYIGELFWCQNTNHKELVADFLVPQFDWRGASESWHKTTMFKWDLRPADKKEEV